MSADAPLPSGSPNVWRGYASPKELVPDNAFVEVVRERMNGDVPVAIVEASPDSLVLVVTKEEARWLYDYAVYGYASPSGQHCDKAVTAKLRAAAEESRHG